MVSIITWNMRGAGSGHSGIAMEKGTYLKSIAPEYDVVLLQECGNLRGQVAGKEVLAAEQAGSFNIRCSTAILAPPGTEYTRTWTGTSTGRSGIWIRYDGFVIATIHCESGGGGADDLKRFATELARNAGNDAKIVIGGDFNYGENEGGSILLGSTDRSTLIFNVYTQDRATHSGGGILDWFICSPNVKPASKPRPARMGTGGSDHRALSATF